ncbi:MAG TPA: hypothetical protein VGD45_25980 [Steroidobacter sp.]|uniref:hypothetical protein n=1 Tax=Steroidobacter sp. TaxID=1978227 RepID=UPI002EDA33AF
MQLTSPPPASQQDRALSLALADRLGVEPGAVRVVVAKQAGNDVHHAVSAMEEMPDQIVGDFTAALRMGDGRWRVVRPIT